MSLNKHKHKMSIIRINNKIIVLREQSTVLELNPKHVVFFNMVGVCGKPEESGTLWSTLTSIGSFACSVAYAHPMATLAVSGAALALGLAIPYFWKKAARD